MARGRDVLLWDADAERTAQVARELGAAPAASREEALAANVVATVTPGREVLFEPGSLRAGQHVSLMGADGPGKAELAVEELARAHVVVDEWEQSTTDGILPVEPRVRLFCDEWDQASHGGDIANAVQAGKIGRDDVTQLGDVLTGEAKGRQSADDITLFDSTGLAVQDLAVAALVYERASELGMDVPTIDL